MQWFKVPSKIYFERNSIQYLQTCEDIERVMSRYGQIYRKTWLCSTCYRSIERS